MVETSVLVDESEGFVVMKVDGIYDGRTASYQAKKSYSLTSKHDVRELVSRQIGTAEHEDATLVVVGPMPDVELEKSLEEHESS